MNEINGLCVKREKEEHVFVVVIVIGILSLNQFDLVLIILQKKMIEES